MTIKHIRKQVNTSTLAVVIMMLYALCLIACKHKSDNTSLTSQDTLNWPTSFEIGRAATKQEIAAWDIDVRPDGKGLPEGQGVVANGKLLYAAKCSTCHGITGSEGPYDRLVEVKEKDSDSKGSKKSIGSYWPYATTVYDYVHRAMPYNAPGSLTPEEVYSITAFLLHANGIIDSTQVINANTLPRVVMPAQKLFVPDDRKGGAEVR